MTALVDLCINWIALSPSLFPSLSPSLSVEVGGISEETAACDWWSLGAILFELLTGKVSRKSQSVILSPPAQKVSPVQGAVECL